MRSLPCRRRHDQDPPFRSPNQIHLLSIGFPDNDNQLEAINFFRCNDPNGAFSVLDLPMPSPPNTPNIPDYNSDSNDFMTAILALADHFEVHGF